MGWFFGFKLHLICNERGELLNFNILKLQSFFWKIMRIIG